MNRWISEQYLETPFYGSRRMTVWLLHEGHAVNRKRVQRLMQLMGLEAISPQPRLSLATQGHRKFPYLLRGLSVNRVNQVWATDITYVPMPRGFMYLVAVHLPRPRVLRLRTPSRMSHVWGLPSK